MMKNCPSCRVHINNNRNTCPFCYRVLTDDKASLDFQAYPKHIRKPRVSLMTKILLFISIVIVFACILVNAYTISLGDEYLWSVIVFAAVLFMWVILKYVFTNIGVITGRIIVASVYTSLFIFLIELFLVKSKDYWFSIDIVIPFIIITTIITVLIFMMANKKLINDTLFPLFGLTLLSMLPLMIVINLNSIFWPSIACAGLGAVTLIYMLIFHTRDVADEFKKRLHF